MIKTERLNQLISNMGFEQLNPTQKVLLESRHDNNILISSTGSGKTFAFLLSAVEFCDNFDQSVVILAPSRELASQIEDVFRVSKSGYNTICCYGGHSIMVEKRSLNYSPRVIIGTPGRIADHIKNQNFDTSKVGMLIFDEFDKLLEFGFEQEMGFISDSLPNVRKRVLSSATQTHSFPSYVDKDSYNTIESGVESASQRMTIRVVKVAEKPKLETLFALLCKISHEPTIVFCKFREVSQEVSDWLYDNFLENEYFHGGMEQFDREKALAKFRNGSCNVLLSTDLAARGIDISQIKNIVHYHVPSSHEEFTHRNGRTARVDREGFVYLLSEKEHLPDYLDNVEQYDEIDFRNTTPPMPEYTTIYMGLGKKDKLSRVDVVGFLCQKGGIEKSDIGIIELKDYHSFVAVKSDLAKGVVKRVFQEKIKNKRTKIAIAK